jgi:hypothetical protein
MEGPGSADPNGEKVAEAPGTARANIQAVRRELSASGPPLYRCPPARTVCPAPKGALLLCSFWLVQTPRQHRPGRRSAPVVRRPALTHAALIQAVLAVRTEQAGVQPIVGGDTARLSP